MTRSILEKDDQVKLPEFRVLKASAGSGKTHALTLRFVQFLLSGRIQQNELRNLMAITFSNNAAKEMKERILSWLKAVYLSFPEETGQLMQLVCLDKETLRHRAGALIDDILENWTEFQVKTIDSFMASVFKSAAIDLGMPPDFDILMDNTGLMEYAFDFYLRDVRKGTPQEELLDRVIGLIHENKSEDTSYLWDPSDTILKQIKAIHKKTAGRGKQIAIENYSGQIAQIKDKITTQVEKIERLINESGLERRKNSAYKDFPEIVKNNRFADLINRGSDNPPVKKPSVKNTNTWDGYNHVLDLWGRLNELIQNYSYYYARIYYRPYLMVYEAFKETLERVKREQGKVFIDDINEKLAWYLAEDIVPDVYLRLGDTIFHYLIDEFQDTSPVQWRNLLPLIENSLAQGGSLFVVGDTKQAIYGFREADYSIMKKTETLNPFPSAVHSVSALDRNYRSRQRIIDFNEKVFKQNLLEKSYERAAQESDLISWTQQSEKKDAQEGYVSVSLIDEEENLIPERSRIQNLIAELRRRGYSYKDIAILTPKNENVVQVTTWLNEKDVPFISFSNLDIRRRKVTGEIMALLNFLDSPPDNLALTTFILGRIFEKALAQEMSEVTKEELLNFLFRRRKDKPLYKFFQAEFSWVWGHWFEPLFKSAGYLPLYDLVTEIFACFKIFENLPEEEATLSKILEVIKDFEASDINSLKAFISFVEEEEDESRWNMDVPEGADAVKVMTIHKAKGLGFPVVIVLLYGEALHRGFPFIIEETIEKIYLLKINKDMADKIDDYGILYNNERIKEEANSLNKLYVGFTRAMSEMYVIGIKGNRDKYPFELLPIAEYSAGPNTGQVISKKEESYSVAQVGHIREVHRQVKGTAGSYPYPEQGLSLDERKRGEFIHRIFSFIDYLNVDEPGDSNNTIDRIIGKVACESRESYDYREIKKTLTDFFNDKQIHDFFFSRPGRRIQKEQEFADDQGCLFRMDRVIIDTDCITVIDYKTGFKTEDQHQVQLRHYRDILSGIFPDRKVTGILAYVDQRQVKKIS